MATRKMLFVLLAAATLNSCVLPIPATIHARGYVRDAATKKPISGARVTLMGHPKATAITASDGSFDIPSEKHLGFVPVVVPMDPSVETRLTVSADGYRSKTVDRSNDNRDILLTPK